MNDKKHIDRLFQEKFKNFEVTPDDAVWHNIHNALHNDKPKRRVMPLWWKLAGIAAVLALLLTVGNVVFNPSDDFNTSEKKLVDTEKTEDSVDSSNLDDVIKSSSEPINSNVITKSDETEVVNTNATISNTTKTVNTQPKTATQIASENRSRTNTENRTKSHPEKKAAQQEDALISTSKKDAVAKNTPNLPQLNANKEAANQANNSAKTFLESEREKATIAQTKDQNPEKTPEVIENKDIIALNTEDDSIEDAIAKANPTNEEEKEEQPNRWNITPNVAPVYFNTLGKGSSIDGQFVNNTKSGEVNMSYGISGSYAINDKIKVRAGVNKVNLGYSTGGVIVYNESNSFIVSSKNNQLQNINFTNQDGSNAFMSTSNLDAQSAPQAFVSSTKGALEQQFGYIEIPLEMEYNIIDSKFGLNVIGGFSTLFLNNNEVFSVLENQRSLIGEANNINSTSFSANFGLGFNYNVSSMLKLNLEPMFKYQINTFTNTSGYFRPYYIGVYTGFSFKF
ncbi:hypothetical protein [Gelidibacter salicanalis]|uniref:Outer membrane protein beta-barrel domain-containing protein n=1 Tax=Gelidibacter salicanalis TaxID=291193 RepID=A0A934KUM2_9FLAO|nr:hypothetical protein [Gelidibacter salicanalis]MBJ7879715.1 hypothetical protein [Gelidibacter salicanalis]